MIVEVAQRLADCDEISSERLEAIAIYLSDKLRCEKEESRATSLIAHKTMRILEETLRIRSARSGGSGAALDDDVGILRFYVRDGD